LIPAGQNGLLGFFVGQVMRQSGGNANPALVSQLVQERLGAEPRPQQRKQKSVGDSRGIADRSIPEL
jgi:hypothetical protein